jgi:hypothetical protein
LSTINCHISQDLISLSLSIFHKLQQVFVSAWRYCGSLPQSRPQGFSLFSKKGKCPGNEVANANGMRWLVVSRAGIFYYWKRCHSNGPTFIFLANTDKIRGAFSVVNTRKKCCYLVFVYIILFMFYSSLVFVYFILIYIIIFH